MYNWENFELNGAPNGVWEIKENKLYLNSVNLYTGLEFDGPEKISVNLSNIFRDREIKDGRLFADWGNGIYLITYGEEVKDEFGLDRFEVSGYTLLRINNGVVIESKNVPSDFNFNKVPKDAEVDLKKLIQDYQKQKKN